MSIFELRRMPRSTAARAAVIGATRALELMYPIRVDEAVIDRLGRAVAELLEAEALATPTGMAKEASRPA
jgi:hypothetical protein